MGYPRLTPHPSLLTIILTLPALSFAAAPVTRHYDWLTANRWPFSKAIAGSIRHSSTKPSESNRLPDKVNQCQARGEFGRDGHIDDARYLRDKFKPRSHQTHDKSWRR